MREALIEYECRCMNLARIRIPIVGKLLGVLGGRGHPPPMQTVTAARATVPMPSRPNVDVPCDELHVVYEIGECFRGTMPTGRTRSCRRGLEAAPVARLARALARRRRWCAPALAYVARLRAER